jgi:hypothetical protein
MARRQMFGLRQEPLIGALRRIRGLLLDQLAFHPVDMILRFDSVVAPEQPRQSGMADRNVQMIGIIVGDRLPVERPRAERDAADRLQLLEPVGSDLRVVRRHHLGDARRARLERHEQEAAPILQRDWKQAVILCPKPRILVAVGYSDQPPVPRIAPRMIGTGQHLGAAACPVDQPRSAMPAHIREGTDFPIVAADDDHTFAEIVDAAPFARLGDLAFVADDLRRSPKEGALLCLEEFRVEIEPPGQTHPVKRVRARGDASELGRHRPALPRLGPGPQSGAPVAPQ